MTRPFVLGIAGSPRKGGNTFILVEESLKAITTRARTEIVNLADDPDPVDVVNRMDEADGIVLGTPSYFGMPTARLKRVLDETWDRARKEAWSGKAGAALTVESTVGGEIAAMSLGQFFTMHRMQFLGFVVGRGLKEREILYDIKAIRDGREVANRVVDHLEAFPRGSSE